MNFVFYYFVVWGIRFTNKRRANESCEIVFEYKYRSTYGEFTFIKYTFRAKPARDGMATYTAVSTDKPRSSETGFWTGFAFRGKLLNETKNDRSKTGLESKTLSDGTNEKGKKRNILSRKRRERSSLLAKSFRIAIDFQKCFLTVFSEFSLHAVRVFFTWALYASASCIRIVGWLTERCVFVN